MTTTPKKLLLNTADVRTVWTWPWWASPGPRLARTTTEGGRAYGQPYSTGTQRMEYLRNKYPPGSVVDLDRLVREMKDAGLFAKSTYNRDVYGSVRDACEMLGVVTQ